jgi:CshA-type fibril repeat protein
MLTPISPASAAQVNCTPSPQYNNCVRITYSGADQSFTIPNTYIPGTPLVAEIWGAGGGGSTYGGAYSPNSGGAAGGYSKSLLVGFSGGDSFTVVVGQGGAVNRTTSYGGGGLAGATSSMHASGGGFSGIFSDSLKTQPIAIAGGGGGASAGSNADGVPGGGGGVGAAAPVLNTAIDGGPATESAGGARASLFSTCSAAPTAGTAYQGGRGANGGEHGGGGGGGYFGGGGGTCQVNGTHQNGGGGGGSGYLKPNVAIKIASVVGGNGVLGSSRALSGAAAVLPASGGQYVNYIGAGGSEGVAGANGMVVFQWSTLPAQSTLTCDSTFYSMQNAQLKKMTLTTPNRSKFWDIGYTNVGTAGTSNMGALAYNEGDNYLYGINVLGQLVRMGSDGSQRIVDTIGDELPVAPLSFSAAGYMSGTSMIFHAVSTTNTAVYKVDTSTVLPTVTKVAERTTSVSGLRDFAIVGSFAYGVDNSAQKLIKMDLTTGLETYVAFTGGTLTAHTSVWYAGGKLYAQTADMTKVYRFDSLTSPVPVQVGEDTTFSVTNGDGANCSTGPDPFPALATPTLAPDTSTGLYKAAHVIDPFANDTTPTGSTLTGSNGWDYSSIRLCAAATTDANCLSGGTYALTTLTVANEGTYSVNTTTGAVTFTPLSTFTGTATAIKYTISDKNGQFAVSTITPSVTAPNASVANNDVTSGKINIAQYMDWVQTNDVTSTGVTWNLDSIRMCTAAQAATNPPSCTLAAGQTTVITTGQGTYTMSAPVSIGRIAFTPTSTFVGVANPVTYKISDSLGRTYFATYTPTVVGLPTIANDTSTGTFGAVQTISPLGNDSAAVGATLSASSVKLCLSTVTVTTSCTSSTLTVANQGTYAVQSNGQVLFTPLSTFSGTATAIKYVASDSVGQSALATITATVTPPAISATSQSKSVLPLGTVAFKSITDIGGLASGSGLTVCLQNAGNTTCTNSVSVTNGGYVLDQATGVVTFASTGNPATGNQTAVSYRVTDVAGQTRTGTLTPVVPAPPVASNDSSVGVQNSTQTISVAGNDVAGSATAPLVSGSVKLCATTSTAKALCSATALDALDGSTVRGSYTLNSDATITFTPVTDWFGSLINNIKYVIADALGQLVEAYVSITVLPPPATRAVADSATAAFAQSIVFQPWNNDSVVLPASGNLSFSVTGTATLSPSSVRLCAPGEAIVPGNNADATNCSSTSLDTIDGRYVVNTSNGDVTFTPAAGFVGTTSTPPTYGICDTVAGWTPTVYVTCASATLIPTILAPALSVAVPDTSIGAMGATQVIDVLSNDTTDPTVSKLVASIKLCAIGQNTASACNAVSLDTVDGRYVASPSTGTVSFTPAVNFSGIATAPVSYAFTDSAVRAVRATITPRVVAAPSSQALSSTGVAGASQTASITIPSFPGAGSVTLIDASGNPTNTVSVVGGTYTLDPATGSISFVPDAGFVGTAPAVNVRVTDSLGQVGNSTFAATVTAPPLSTPSNYTSAALEGIDQSRQASIPTNGSITLVGSNNNPVTSIAIAGKGTYSIDTNTGVITFSPVNGFSGVVPSATYKITDEYGQTATGTYTATVNAAPPAAPNPAAVTSTGLAGAPQTAAVTIPAGGSVRLLDGSNNPTNGPIAVSGGSYSLNPATGVITFTPSAGFTGTPPPATFRVTDAFNQTGSATFTPSVTLPAAPTASPLTAYGQSGVASTTTVSIPAGGSATLLDSSSNPTNTVSVVGGTYVLNPASGVVTFTPAAGFSGTAPAVDYRVTDLYGQTSGSTVKATVIAPPPAPAPAPAPAAPTLQADSVAIAANTASTGSLTANDSFAAGSSVTVASQPAHGTLTIAADGTYVYTPAVGYSGTDTFTYRVCLAAPNASTCSTATATVSISPPPPLPALQPDAVVIPSGSTATGNVLDNDSFAAGSTVSVTTQPANGTVTLAADGTFVYTPANGYSGTDTFTYRVCLAAPNATVCSTETVSITTNPAPPAPVAPVIQADTFAMISGGSASGNVGANDSFAPGSTFTVVNQPANGSVLLNADGTFTFIANAGYVGSDSFTYTVCLPAPNQATCASASASVSIAVNPAPPAPVLQLDSLTSTAGSSATATVAANDSVAPGSIFTVAVAPTSGTLVLNPDGTFTYTASSNASGTDSFVYEACLPSPNTAVCDTQYVLITVRPAAVVTAPVATTPTPTPTPTPEPTPAPTPEPVVAPDLKNHSNVVGYNADGTPKLAGVAIAKAVLFAPDSPKLNGAAKAELNKVVAFAKKNGGRVMITGFVRYRGRPASFDIWLATARAKNVAAYLKSKGVNTWIDFDGYGPVSKKISNPSQRKVEVRWTKNVVRKAP